MTFRIAFLPLVLSVLASRAVAQEFNIDFHNAASTPPATYAAAGKAGAWNGIAAIVPNGPIGLFDLAGNGTPVQLRVAAGAAGWNGLGGWTWNNPSTSGGDQALMDDILDVGGGYPTGPVSELVVSFTGLQPGDYEIYTYSFAPDNYLPGNGGSAWTTRIDVPGSPSGQQVVGSLDWPASGHTHLQTYALHTLTVGPSGTLSIQLGAGAPDLGFGSLNGIQIVRSVPQPVSYCTAGTSTNGCTPTLTANSNPNASFSNSCLLSVSGTEGQKTGLIFYGINNSGYVPQPWGNGSSFLCVKAPTQRTPASSTGGTAGQCNGAFLLNLNAFQLTNPGALGQPFTAGSTLFAQAWYRDPPAPKTTNLSDALRLTVLP
ncbi:MAG: hypothetical protein NTV21_03040 [Planctomycetota bacterium]|nr:hypothetical protein [Planctomycetota bacterium]